MKSNVSYIPAKRVDPGMNVGIYCRVSSNHRNQLNSLAAQISSLTRAVSHVEQWKLADVFIDIASAREDAPRREFERMIRECEAHRISVIITKSVSRFGRDTVDTLEAIKRLKAAGIRIIFDEESIDTKEIEDDLLISILESFVQAENESRSISIRMGLRTGAINGKSGNYRKRLYGYIKNREGELIIEPDQAKVVRDIYRWYLDGASVVGIIKELAEHQIPSPSGKETWSKRSVENILTNEKYIGTVRLIDPITQDREYVIMDCHPPIITEDEFRSVQEEKKRRSNIVRDENGTHRKSVKYSSKGK